MSEQAPTKDQVSPLVQWVNSSPEITRWYLRETLKVDTSELIWARMQVAGVSKVDLAKRLGCSKAHVTQLLNGSRNMTLQTLQDIALALGCRADVKFVEIPK
jgi:antitoxin component HigA of HigAB toxin-antitoxin module